MTLNDLTRDDILKLPAGQRLDLLIAESIMGKQYAGAMRCDGAVLEPGLTTCPPYSTDGNAMLEVVEKLTKKLDDFIDDDGERYGYWTLDRLGFDCCRDGRPDTDSVHGQWRCHFGMNRSEEERIDVFATADTAPHAVALAALLAAKGRTA